MAHGQPMEHEIQSKTQKKKEDKLLQHLGEQLTGLSSEQTDRMELTIELREALLLARKTTAHGARRRQVKYIGTLLRHIDTAPILRALAFIQRGRQIKDQTFKRIESWRDALKQGEMNLIDDITVAFPEADRQRLVQLAANAKNEAGDGKGSKASRALFRYLREIVGG